MSSHAHPSVAIHPNRPQLRNAAVIFALLALLFGLLHALWLSSLEAAYGDRALPFDTALLFATNMVLGLGSLLAVLWAVVRVCDPAPALILSPDGIAIIDRPPVSLAPRPVFLRWEDISFLQTERTMIGVANLRLGDADGREHRIVLHTLAMPIDRLTLTCLAHLRATGVRPTEHRFAAMGTNITRWSLTPA